MTNSAVHHVLAIPSGPSSRTALVLAVTISPRGLIAPFSQELHTIGLLQSHVLVGHWRQYSR